MNTAESCTYDVRYDLLLFLLGVSTVGTYYLRYAYLPTRSS